MPGKYELKRSRDGQFMFNLRAPNGEVILTSERYANKSNAKRGIDCVRDCSRRKSNFEERGRSFVLKGGNGHVIGRSETYNSNRALQNGIASVSKNGPKGKVDDRC